MGGQEEQPSNNKIRPFAATPCRGEDAAGSSAVYLSSRSCQDPALDGWVWRDVPGRAVSLGKAARRWGLQSAGMCVRAIWQSRAGGPPLREIEGGDGVNIRKTYVWATCCPPGRRNQPGVLSITRFPDWTEPDQVRIARQGCQGLIVTINPAGSRVWSGPGARRKCRGLTS